jgi:hypothetical protein
MFELADRAVNMNDILPTTHSISAFDGILNKGMGLADMWFEIVAIMLLSVVFFTVGTTAFARRHMSANAV